MIEIEKLEAGPKLDVLLAEKVMGFTWDVGNDDGPGYDGRRTLWGPKREPKADPQVGPEFDPDHLLDDGAYACIWKRGGELSVWLCDRPHMPTYSTATHWALTIVHELRRRGFSFQMHQAGAHHYMSTDGRFTVFNSKTKVSFTCHNAVCGDGKISVVDGVQRSPHEISGGNGHGAVLIEADTAALAICRAALKAVGADK